MNRRYPVTLFPLILGLALALGWLWAMNPPATHAAPAASTRYVAVTGADSGNCSSAATPCRTPQYALGQSAAGDEIRLAAGVYTGTNDLAGLSQVVYVSQSITLRGGYAPPNWTTPDPVANPTILDAESQGRVVSIIDAGEVTIEGLRLTNGLAAGMGSLYLGQYLCGGGVGGTGFGGGLCVENAAVTLNQTWILTNTGGTAGGRGGGLFAAGAAITLTNSIVQGNNAATGYNRAYGGGVFVVNGQALVEGNSFLGNIADPNYDGDGGGVYVYNATAMLRGNVFLDNYVRGDTSSPSRLGGGGAAASGSAVTITGNQFIGNTASGYTGGALAWSGGLITVTENLILSNTASWGGGIWAGNAPAVVDNNVLAGNTAATHGSALYVNTYNPNRPSLRHNTIARNSGGDDVAIYIADYGRASFYNTILAENTIGVAVAWGTSVSFERTLWDSNITDTVGLIDEVGHLAGLTAFAADGYHLTEASDAVDAGIATALTTDVDGETRPRGNAPDIGADESPFSQGSGSGSVDVEKIALPPRLMLTTHGWNGQPEYLIQQEYLIQIANGLSNTALSSFAATDWLPAILDYDAQVHYPPMSFSAAGNTLNWDSLAPLPAENLAWMALVGNAFPEDGGQVVTNTAAVTYSLSGGGTFTDVLQVSSLIPNFPPFITTPEAGEYCLDAGGYLEIWGVAKPGAEIFVYEDGVTVTQVTASITGTFYASYAPAQWAPDAPVILSARDCTGGNCGDLSNTVVVRMPDRGWCPQRSIWQGMLGENLFRWPFRNAAGEMSTHDWEIPGAFGFWDTTLTVYECDVPDPGYHVIDIVVEADGQMYQDENGPDADGAWEFGIASAHTVNIVVTAEDDTAPGTTKTYTSHGFVLIDPDGFVFDVSEGFEVISSTPDGVPIEVANTVPGVTVTCMVSMPNWGGWVPWPAHFYDEQINPQVTGENGYFAFFTPPGLYYLQVDGVDGYQSWRSPLIEVITEIVHVNVPLTPLAVGSEPTRIVITPEGPDQPVVTIPAGSRVAWVSTLDPQATALDLARYVRDPILRLLSDLNPLQNTLGWDSGMLPPGPTYERRFIQPGTYTYTDGAGHTGTIIVQQYRVYLPVVRK